ncbi:MAG: S9 family peptidase [Chlorobi bacterium]|nr:S9 family peptidase [Chlorobiota bacterium]
MKRISFIIVLMLLYTMVWPQENDLIFTKEELVIDTFYNTYIVQDKYRWLENLHSEETLDWVKNQNKHSRKYLTRASTKTNSMLVINKYAYTEYENPQKDGDYYFTYAYYNDLSVPALFYQNSLRSSYNILVDPNYISSKDRILLKGYSVSKDSKFLAYQFSRNGSDWAELKVVSLTSGNHKKDHLVNLKYSNIAWKDDGVFYSTYPRVDQMGKSLGQKVLYHKLGTDQSEDKVIFKRSNPKLNFSFLTTSNERFFILKEKNEERGTINIFYIDYESELKALKPLVMNITKNVGILDSHEGKFIAITHSVSNNGSIIEIDPSNPTQWRAIVSEYSKALLLEVIPFTDRIVAIYQSNQHPIITVYDYNGVILHSIELPVSTSVSGFSGESSDEELLYYFTSYTIPPIVYEFNIKTYEDELTKQTEVTFDFTDIAYKEVEYISKDSVSVPMTLVYMKDLELNGSNPTILKAYGGFGAVETPSFDAGIVYFIKKGGVFAFANIRGGGDKGAEWANDGRGLRKQNSFDDFIAAAEYLIKEGYTNSDKLAAIGASNGGLVVSAAAVQRPDLFKAVVPIVAPFDMLRFENFTVGNFHLDEYGTVTDSLSFTKLYAYSPYQNIQEDVNYPSMLVVTSENDDRVPPFNSYKFVARMQSRPAQKNPVLLTVGKKTGHSGSSSKLSYIKQKANIYGFIMNELMND